MAIEDFEWEGGVEQTQPSQARLAMRGAVAPPESVAFWRRWLKSVWLEPALRLVGGALLLGVLAVIGVVATTYAKPGLPLPNGSRVLTDALGTHWLKPSPAPSHGAALSSGATPPADGAAQPAPSAPPVGAREVTLTPSETVVSGAGITADGRVILNVASADELTKLPGIGMKRAQAIIALRAKLKRFKHPSDLLRVKGIGPRSLQRMLPHLVLDAP